MPIRICRASALGLAIGASWFLAACAPSSDTRPDGPAASLTPEAQLEAAEDALERRDYPAAAQGYREAAQRSDDETVAEQATRVAFDHHQLRQAALAAERWLQLNPTSENARRYAGVVALKLHRLDEAEKQFASLLETVYISPAAGFLALAPVVSGEAAPADLMDLFRRLSALYPDVAEGYYAYGAAALRGDNYAAAARAAETAVAKAPHWKPARMLLARARIATGQEEEGLAMARELVTDADSDLGTHLEYAMMLAATGRNEEARAMLTPYATGKTVIPGAVRTLGVMELDAGNLDAASAQFENLLSTGAQSYEALYYLGVIAERRKDLDRAERYYSRVAAGDYSLPAQQRVARIKAGQSGVEAGLAHLDEVARSQPQSAPDLYSAKASLLSIEGDDRRAAKVYDEGVERYPDVLELRLNRVFFYERTGKQDAAIRELRELLAERPGDAQLQNALGYTLADNDRNLDEARKLLMAALAQSPDNAATLDSMGWLLYREGKYSEALDYLQRASKSAADPEIDLHVGEVQWAMGEQDAARKTWAAALERAPDDDKLRKRLERAGR
ncbi:MAG TPA: tetratricopeptide repeat protein [Steroidobacteraceae bacterium]|nr:tetratricopeptide repeat protein [Steroidobacteraceae bacterium]